MILKKLLHFIIGYVRIAVEGYFVERFINICKNNKIKHKASYAPARIIISYIINYYILYLYLSILYLYTSKEKENI